MRISDWSSDVCSSDLAWQEHVAGEPGYAFLSDKEKDEAANRFFEREREAGRLSPTMIIRPEKSIFAHASRDEAIAALKSLNHGTETTDPLPDIPKNTIGRASCREKVGQYS